MFPCFPVLHVLLLLIRSCVLQSCLFHPCDLVTRCPVLRFSFSRFQSPLSPITAYGVREGDLVSPLGSYGWTLEKESCAEKKALYIHSFDSLTRWFNTEKWPLSRSVCECCKIQYSRTAGLTTTRAPPMSATRRSLTDLKTAELSLFRLRGEPVPVRRLTVGNEV